MFINNEFNWVGSRGGLCEEEVVRGVAVLWSCEQPLKTEMCVGAGGGTRRVHGVESGNGTRWQLVHDGICRICRTQSMWL